jgi:hypothetical protein
MQRMVMYAEIRIVDTCLSRVDFKPSETDSTDIWETRSTCRLSRKLPRKRVS